jgi:hypothetical protein
MKNIINFAAAGAVIFGAALASTRVSSEEHQSVGQTIMNGKDWLYPAAEGKKFLVDAGACVAGTIERGQYVLISGTVCGSGIGARVFKCMRPGTDESSLRTVCYVLGHARAPIMGYTR